MLYLVASPGKRLKRRRSKDRFDHDLCYDGAYEQIDIRMLVPKILRPGDSQAEFKPVQTCQACVENM
jgi:hypothetical protein